MHITSGLLALLLLLNKAKTLSKASLLTVPGITKDIVVFLVLSCSLPIEIPLHCV